MPTVLYISEQLPNMPGWESVTGDDLVPSPFPTDLVPSVNNLQSVDCLCVLGQLGNEERARQLAGVVRLALPTGLLVVIGYPEVAEEGLRALINQLTGALPNRAMDVGDVQSAHSAFAAYFTVFGRSRDFFENVPDNEVLGTIATGPVRSPAAFCAERGQGLIYVVPYYIAGGQSGFLQALFDAVLSHRDGAGASTPVFLSGLRLPGEDEVLAEIAERETELIALRESAAYLEHFRRILGRASGQDLENLVIEALNVVLEGTGYRAEDREDVRVEDFWIVGPEGDFALAEVKGQNTHVRRDDVNQVDSHREELEVLDLHGLLVVNVFRQHEDIVQRRLPVAHQAVRRAAASDVVVMRTTDLYELISRKLGAETNIGARLIEALQSGGGWLEVTGERVQLHTE